jgi:hypothetical protein
MNAELEQYIANNAVIGDFGDCVSVTSLRRFLDGKVLVPVEPTDAMVDALFPGTGTHTCRELYKAMLAASQEQVSATAQEPA